MLFGWGEQFLIYGISHTHTSTDIGSIGGIIVMEAFVAWVS